MKPIIIEGDTAKCPVCEKEISKNESGNYPGKCENCTSELKIGDAISTNESKDDSKYSSLKTLAGFFGLIAILSVVFGIGIAFWLAKESLAAGIAVLISGVVGYLVFNAFKEVISLFINIADDVNAIRNK